MSAGMARSNDPGTSWIAAARSRRTAGDGQRRVLAALTVRPMTDAEIAAHAHMDGGSASKRRLDLQRAGRVIPTDRVRPTSTGSPARVWQITPTGREFLRNDAVPDGGRGIQASTAGSTLEAGCDGVLAPALFDPEADERWSSQWGRIK
jgi:hypothetical protein